MPVLPRAPTKDAFALDRLLNMARGKQVRQKRSLIMFNLLYNREERMKERRRWMIDKLTGRGEEVEVKETVIATLSPICTQLQEKCSTEALKARYVSLIQKSQVCILPPLLSANFYLD